MQNVKTLLAGGLLSLTAVNAHATLTTNASGLGVYSSVSDATWTQDANLLGTLESTQGYNTIVNAIIDASGGVIHDTPNSYDYTLTANDFGGRGLVNWWAAQAFVHYLDTINYGGSNLWALPTQSDQSSGNTVTNIQLGELYYNELNALAYPGTNGSDFGILHDGSFGTSGNAGPFANARTSAYWSGTVYASNHGGALLFGTDVGILGFSSEGNQFYAWAVSPGQVGQLSTSAVPVPGAVWLFGTGLVGWLGLKQRKHVG